MVFRPLTSARMWLRLLAHLLLLSLCWYATPLWAARLPSAQRECAVCHIMWLNDFKRTDVDTLIPYDPTPVTQVGKTDVVSTRRMCFSCHDGFMLDSRYMWQEGVHSHPVGMKPSEKIKIPLLDGKEIFPLNADGNIYCGTCHTAHGVDWEQTESAVFMRVRNENGKLCSYCHTDKNKGPEQGSHPLLKKIDKVTGKLSKVAKFGDNRSVVCQSCHRSHGATDSKLLIVDDDGGSLCGSCHTDKYAGGDRAAAGRAGTHPVNVKPVTAVIPNQMLKQGGKLTREGGVTCQTCHSVHHGTPANKLLVSTKMHDDFCVQCHQKQKIVANGKHDMRLVDAGNKNIKNQSVQDSGVCSACHVVHGGTGPKMWARSLDKSKEPMSSLCLSCHRDGGLAEKSQIGQYSHPVGVDIRKLEQEVNLPSYSRDGVKFMNGKSGAVTCASCHDPHQWDPLNTNAKAKPGAKSNNSNRFLRQVFDSDSKLCISCHKKQENISGTKHDLSLTAPQAWNILKQTPKSSGICGSCHLVHNARGAFLWARKLNPGDAPVSATCTSCHRSDGIAKEKELGHSHPLGVSSDVLPVKIEGGHWSYASDRGSGGKTLTPLPLYDDKGSHTAQNGNIGCGSCHDPHNWSPSSVSSTHGDVHEEEGDANSSFLRIIATGDSKLCTNCHVDKGDVVQSKHNMLKSSMNKKVPRNTANKPAGVCLSCHKPHKAGDPVLWARNTGPGKGSIEVLCTACHQVNGNAGDKLIGDHSHPTGIKLKASMRSNELPLYSRAGRVDKDDGLMDCATCHDPHRWAPPDYKNGKPVLAGGENGDARNSFLRISAAPDSRLCLTCHHEQRWVIGTDHDLRISGPRIANRLGEAVDASGVCGQCHTPHNAAKMGKLWARFPGDHDGNPAGQRCRSCHRDDVAAEGRAPRAAGHPGEVKIWPYSVETTLKGPGVIDIPLYDAEGEKEASGVITCPSCHEPHQWIPGRKAEGPGQDTEGDVTTSFLRVGSTGSFLCADCHGQDSIFRYKYYHSPSVHKLQ